MSIPLLRSANSIQRSLWLSLALGTLALLQAAGTGSRSFDLPADSAEVALKRFSEQAALEVFYPSSVVVGIRTKAVKGSMPNRVALDRMLEGTGLTVVQDASTGAFSVKRTIDTSGAKSSSKKNDLTGDNGAVAAAAQPAALPASGRGTISGRILNESNRQYLVGASIVVVGTNLSTVSEEGGQYVLSGVPAGDARLAVTFLGLDTVEETVPVGAGRAATRDFNLSRKSEKGEVVLLQPYEVVSEREGSFKALQQQRSALNIKSVVSADAFGDVSEGNVGEFLKLMPGVMLDYIDADVRTASISGMDPKYTLIMMDGAPVASAGSSSSATNRTFEFEQLSIASIEAVELSKTPTPDVAGSALAGVVNLRSKGAFDRKDRQIRFALSGEMNSNQLTLGRTPGPGNERTRKISPYYSIEFSDKFLGNRLGVLAGFSSTETFVEQNIITHDWARNTTPTDNATEIPRMSYLQMTDAPKITTRANYNLRLDYKLLSGLTGWSRVDYNTYEALNYRRDLTFNFNNAVTTNPAIEYSMDSQTSTNVQIFPTAGFSFNKHGATTTLTQGLAYKRSAFRADVTGQMSRSTNKYNDVEDGFLTSSTAQLAGLGFRWQRHGDFDPAINVVQTSGPDWRNPASYTIDEVIAKRNPTYSREERWTAKADFRYDWANARMPVGFKWGGDVSEQIRDTHAGSTFNINYLGADGVASTADDRWVPEAYPLRNLAGGNLQDVPIPDRFLLADLYKSNPEQFTAPTAAQIVQRELTTNWYVKEQVDSLYQQTIVKVTPAFTLAPGVRFERTRSMGRGPTDHGDRYAKQKLAGSPTANIPTNTVDYAVARYGDPINNYSRYDTWLKYLHASYRFNEALILKASFNNSISRPNLNNLAGNVTLNETVTPPTATIPNPELQPESGRNFYASLEYYFPKGAGFASLSLARRDFQGLIRNTTIDIPVGGSFPNSSDLDLGGYRVTTVDNVARAHLSSAELSVRQNLIFLPGFWKSFSVFGNATAIRFDSYENFRRPRLLANGGLSFDRRGFSLRWSTAWVPSYRIGAYNNAGWAAQRGARLGHDLQLTYRFSRNLSVFLNGRNVFNRRQTNYQVSGDRLLLSNYNNYGAIWNGGIRGQF